MKKKQPCNSRIYIILCFLIYSSISFAQDCSTVSLEGVSNPGEYNVSTLTELDGIRNGPDYAGATIYYPIGAVPPYASIVIVPGFISAEATIQSWGPYLASHGIVTMTIGTNSLFDVPTLRRNALLDAMETLAQENDRPNSPLMDAIDTERMAVSGWSMGGGGAQLAAVADSSIKAVVALCPWLDSNQLTASDLDHDVPLLIFSGENDGVAPPAFHANRHYNFTPSTTNKLIFEIENADHNVANDPVGGDEYIGKIALSWLKYHLEGDSCYCPLVIENPPTASDYQTNVICSEITTTIQDELSSTSFTYQVYPNPTQDLLNLEVENVEEKMTFEIVTLSGMRVSKGIISNKITPVDIQNLASGIYLMNVIQAQGSKRIKFVVL